MDWGFLGGKESTCQCRRCQRCGFNPWVGKILWRREWQATPVSLPGKFHGQRNFMGYSPWDRKESDTTEQLTLQQQTNRTDSIVIGVKTNHSGKWGVSCSPWPNKKYGKTFFRIKYGTSLVAQLVKSLPACNAGDQGSIPGLGRSSGEGNGNPFQYSRLENPMDRGAWQAAVHRVTWVGHNLATKPPPPGSNIFLFENTDSNLAISLTFKN